MAVPRRGIISVLIVVLAISSGAWSEEPVETFLKALRENDFHDAALWYLDRMESSPLAPADFRAEAAYQRGITLVEAAVLQRDGAVRERKLEDAKASLERFLQRQSKHPKASAARRQLGILLREWARMKVAQGKRTGNSSLRADATKLYDQAYAIFDGGREELKARLSKFQGTKPDTQEAIDRRDALRGEYLLSLLNMGEVVEEKADAATAGSAEQKKLLNDAIERYGKMFADYGGRLAGLRARLYQARATKKQGDIAQALVYLTEDVLTQDSDNRPPARKLKVQAMLLAMECWLDESQENYAEAMARGTAYIDDIRPAEYSDADWVLLRLVLARANQRYADALAAKNPRDPQVKLSREAATKLARAVARVPGQYQEEARAVLAELPSNIPAARVEGRPPPKDFEEAKNRGNDAVAEMKSAEFSLESIPAQLNRETNEKVKEELRTKLKEAEESIARFRDEAMSSFQLALQLADSETLVEDLNMVRARKAYIHYVLGDYYDAIVLGEFVCRRFPESSDAKLGAQVALAASVKLHGENSSDDRAFEGEHIVSLANYIIDTWSGEPEAAEAVTTLIPFLIQQGKVDEAREYVEDIPADSAQRGPAELRIGQALWRDYLIGTDQITQWEKAMGEPGADTAELTRRIANRKTELERIQQIAAEILQAGVQRMKSSEVIDTLVPDSVLALARIYIEQRESIKALELLDDQQVGVLSMLDRNEPAVASPTLKEKAYRVALSALIAAVLEVEDTEARRALIDRIRNMIEPLKQVVSDSADGQKRLAGVFYSLARTLEPKLKVVANLQDRRVLSEAFATILDELRSRAMDVAVLNWIAESYVSLGRDLASDASSTDAGKYFEESVATYERILENADSLALSPILKRHFQVRSALALRESGQFERATEIFADVLAEENSRLENQIEAAKTYQLWGAKPKQARHYLDAIQGAVVDDEKKQNVIWGWSRLARNTQRQKKFRDTFHEAHYNTATCHYKYALRLRKKSDRERYLERAKNDIVFTQRLYPTMGGGKQRAQYDELLKLIQRALNERAVGLATASKK